MVQGALDLIVGGERGACSIAGSSAFSGFVLQAVFVVEAVSVWRAELERFLAPEPIFVQVDDALEIVRDEVDITGDAELWQLQDATEFRNNLFPLMLEKCRGQAEDKAVEFRSAARARMQKELGGELKRLVELRRVNDHIREDEIEAAGLRINELDAALSAAGLRLDSLCLIFGRA
jgi:ATP-dependent helicase HepA